MRLNGCHNRAPFATEVWMQDGWLTGSIAGQPVRVPRMVAVPMRNARECMYHRDPMGQGGKDPRCAGCTWKGEGNGSA